MTRDSARPATALPATHAIPGLRYADANAAIAWLAGALGADARHVYPGPDGGVAHAELWFGGGCVMLGSMREGMPPATPGQGSVYVVLDSAAAVDAQHERAASGGARVVMPIHDTDYGSHDFACLDPEGNCWSFGTYAPA